jgi:hypothetical protein
MLLYVKLHQWPKNCVDTSNCKNYLYINKSVHLSWVFLNSCKSIINRCFICFYFVQNWPNNRLFPPRKWFNVALSMWVNILRDKETTREWQVSTSTRIHFLLNKLSSFNSSDQYYVEMGVHHVFVVYLIRCDVCFTC